MKKNTGKYKYKVFIGSKDKDNQKIIFDIEETAKFVNEIFKEYSVAFSLNFISGGYVMYNGNYITESSLCITCVTDIDLNTLKLLFNEIKLCFNQESILIVRTQIKVGLYE